MFDDPFNTKTNRHSPAWSNREFDISTQKPICHEKETLPGKEPLFGRKAIVEIALPLGNSSSSLEAGGSGFTGRRADRTLNGMMVARAQEAKW
jgi:hypothetical protein